MWPTGQIWLMHPFNLIQCFKINFNTLSTLINWEMTQKFVYLASLEKFEFDKMLPTFYSWLVVNSDYLLQI